MVTSTLQARLTMVCWNGQGKHLTTAQQTKIRRRIMRYDTNGRLEFVRKPIPPGKQAPRPFVQNFYNDLGQVWKVLNELGHETKYDYDAVGRLVKTTYPDSSTETVRFDFDSTNNTYLVHRKNRKEVISRSEYDAAGRMLSQISAYAIATDPSWHSAVDQSLAENTLACLNKLPAPIDVVVLTR